MFWLFKHKSNRIWFSLFKGVIGCKIHFTSCLNINVCWKCVSRIQPLWLPPIATRGNPHLSFNSIRTSFPMLPVPETDSLHRCCPLTLVYLTCSPTHLSAKSCSCHADNSERLFHDWFLLPDLDCLPVNERTLPARSDLLCCVNLFSYLPCRLPWLTCPNTVYDSALSTLFLTLECDLCLFDLFGDLIKLHMDLNDTASALQKTSPPIDPAAFYHFTTEVTTQASILATHQQQLNRLTYCLRRC